MDFINLPLLLLSFLLMFSILTSLVSTRANIPLILVFLCIGLLVGDGGGLAIVPGFHSPKIAFFIGNVALALILFDSGYQTSFKSYKLTAIPSLLLATVGVLLTTLLLAPAAYYILGLNNWFQAFLLASIISSTDSASVFFLLRMGGVSIRDKIKSTLEIESGSNDPMAIFLTFSFITLLQAQASSFSWMFLLTFIQQMGIGTVAGIFMAYVIQKIINKIDLDTALYPILLISMVLSGFAIINIIGGSGFLALYIAGILLGNSKLHGHHQILRVQTSLTWLSQIIMFMSLGLYANISEFPSVLVPALVLGGLLILVSRPLAVFACLAPFSYTFREKTFISFVGLRGATSILLAIAPLVYNIAYAETFFNIIFLMVLMSLAIQGFFIVPMAKVCHVTLPVIEKPADKSEIDLPGLSDSYLVSYKLSENTPAIHGKKIPKWAAPIIVRREGISYNGYNVKQLMPEDRVYLFASSEKRMNLLDTLYGGGTIFDENEDFGDFSLSPNTTLQELSYMYGIQVDPKMQAMTLCDVLVHNFSDIEVGDRFALDTVELIVRKMDNGLVEEVGLDLEPDAKSFGRLLIPKKRLKK